MSEHCELREANGLPEQHCDKEVCIFWRIAEHVGGPESGDGCAIQHYQLMGDEGVAAWLLSVKERLDRTG